MNWRRLRHQIENYVILAIHVGLAVVIGAMGIDLLLF